MNRLNDIYYFIKPVLPRWFQIILRRMVILGKKPFYADVWPINEKAGKLPTGWKGWPERKRFALLLTHDVESVKGIQQCQALMRLEDHLGFRSSFNFIAKEYAVPPELRHHIVENGYEVGIHGLYHNGEIYKSQTVFMEQAFHINQYLKEWEAVGFRSPCMFHNVAWMASLNIEYDASTFDTDPFEPQPDGVNTIFPFWVQNGDTSRGIVEIPYTLPQDFTLFVLMKQKNIDIWKRKLDWIAKQGGMVLVNVHPDYLNFSKNKCGLEEYPNEFYKELLNYIKIKYEGQYWNPLPKEMAQFWRKEMVGKGENK